MDLKFKSIIVKRRDHLIDMSVDGGSFKDEIMYTFADGHCMFMVQS